MMCLYLNLKYWFKFGEIISQNVKLSFNKHCLSALNCIDSTEKWFKIQLWRNRSLWMTDSIRASKRECWQFEPRCEEAELQVRVNLGARADN